MTDIRKPLYCVKVYVDIQFDKRISKFSLIEREHGLTITMREIERTDDCVIYASDYAACFLLQPDWYQLNFEVDFDQSTYGESFNLSLDSDFHYREVSKIHTKYKPEKTLTTLSIRGSVTLEDDSWSNWFVRNKFTIHKASIELHLCETIDDI